MGRVTARLRFNQQFLNKLTNISKDVKFDIFGINKIQPIWGDSFLKAISNSRMGLNLSRGQPIKYYSSDRIAQLFGNGLLTFIDKNTILDDFFNKDVEITEDLSEGFTPHEINYDVTERVDFEKGCYTGQEIVSRMHYRAKSLPRLYLAQGSNALLEANVSVEDNTGKRAGTIVKVLNHLDGSYALISIKVNEVDKSYKTSKGRTNLTIKK